MQRRIESAKARREEENQAELKGRIKMAGYKPLPVADFLTTKNG
jgi:hypothetical protein